MHTCPHLRGVFVVRLEVLRGALEQQVAGGREHHHVAALLDALRGFHPRNGAFRQLALFGVLALAVLVSWKRQKKGESRVSGVKSLLEDSLEGFDGFTLEPKTTMKLCPFA